MFHFVFIIHCRGRYDIKLFPTFLQLHGKTFDYKIPYSTVIRLFLLPHKDGRQAFFVVSILTHEVGQHVGDNNYNVISYLYVMAVTCFIGQRWSSNQTRTDTLPLPHHPLQQRRWDECRAVPLPVSDIQWYIIALYAILVTHYCSHFREELERKYDGKLTKEMSGAEYEVVSRLMKALTGKKITVPGNFNRSIPSCLPLCYLPTVWVNLFQGDLVITTIFIYLAVILVLKLSCARTKHLMAFYTLWNVALSMSTNRLSTYDSMKYHVSTSLVALALPDHLTLMWKPNRELSTIFPA